MSCYIPLCLALRALHFCALPLRSTTVTPKLLCEQLDRLDKVDHSVDYQRYKKHTSPSRLSYELENGRKYPVGISKSGKEKSNLKYVRHPSAV